MDEETEDERLTRAYGSTTKTLKTHTDTHLQRHPLIKTLENLGGKC